MAGPVRSTLRVVEEQLREAPQVDCARAHGFYLDPSLVPPDDEHTDAVCELEAAFANARLDAGLDDGHGLDVAPGCELPGVASSRVGVSLLRRGGTSAGGSQGG